MGGRSKTSVLNRPQFRVSWKDVTRVSRDVTTGMTEAEAQAVSRHDKPILVYVYNDEAKDNEDARFAIEAATAFIDEKVAVGTRFFDCVRIDAESAKKDRALKDHVGRANSLVFVRPNYEVADALHFRGTRVNARKVFGEMCATLRLDYENCAKKAYSAMRKIQKERVELDEEAQEVRELDAEILEEESARKRAKLIAKRDKIQKKLDDAYLKIDEAEGKLFSLTPKEQDAKTSS
jgi:hypothetical protein